MVMVHYLDSETPQQRAATLARLERLGAPARSKLLEIVDVDGAPVAVTLFLSSFVDFATWLESVSDASPLPPPIAPVLAVPLAVTPPPVKPASDFTRVFGKIEQSSGEYPPMADAGPSAEAELDTPTLIMAPTKPAPAPRAPEQPTPVPAQAPASAPPPSESGFTAIFGRLGDAPFAPPVAPPLASNGSSPAIMPPMASFADDRLPAAPPAAVPSAPPPAPQPGEFTQLFQRISPAAGSNPLSFLSLDPAASPPRAPEVARPIETRPAADFTPPSLGAAYLTPPSGPSAPSLGSSAPPPLSLGFGAAPLAGAPGLALPPAPNFSGRAASPNGNDQLPPASPAPAWGAAPPPPSLGSSLDVGVQSEFTRILGRVSVPPPPPIAMPQPPAAGAQTDQKPAKSLVPLLVALNVVVLLTLVIVGYFVMHKS